MLKVTGLEKLQRQFQQAQEALSNLENLGVVEFDPTDPESINHAINSMEEKIDEHIAPYSGNAIVASFAAQMKEKYRSLILEKAAATRMGNAE